MNMYRTKSLTSLTSSVITEEEKPYIKEVLKEKVKYIIESTTAHGIPHFIAKKRFILKLIWLIFFLISLGLCFQNVAQNIQQYLSFDVNTLVQVVPKAEIVFPEISICNLNPFISKKAYTYIQNYYLNNYNVSISTYSQLFDLIASGQIPNDNDWLIYQTYNPNFDLTLRTSLGYDIYNMIFETVFKFRDPKFSQFNAYYHAKYGNCIVFNSGVDMEGNASKLGVIHDIEYGLQISLFTGFTESSKSYLYQNFNKGAVIIINDQNSRDLDKEGILIQPGTHVNIVLTKTTSMSLSFPYSNCFDANSVKITVLALEMSKLGLVYSRYNCMTFCRQKIVIRQLKCYDVRYPQIFNATPCVTKAEFDELKNITFDMSECEDLCPFECVKSTYEWNLSYGTYPSYVSYKYLLYNFRSQFNYIFGTSKISFDTIGKTMAKFFVFFDPMAVTEITQAPSLTIIDLIANVGGTLGLFIGLSLLSFVELIELVYDTLLACFQYLRKKNLVQF